MRPQFNFVVNMHLLNLEVYALDQVWSLYKRARGCAPPLPPASRLTRPPSSLVTQNYVDVIGVGDWWRGRSKLHHACGGGDTALSRRLHAVGMAGEAMLRKHAEAGAHDPSRKRRVLILQHYPGRCKPLAEMFRRAAPETAAMLDIRCAFGHTHSTKCEHGGAEFATGDDSDCEHVMIGAGGGCCEYDDVRKGGAKGAGFGVLHFTPRGGMRVERVTINRECNLLPIPGAPRWSAFYPPPQRPPTSPLPRAPKPLPLPPPQPPPQGKPPSPPPVPNSPELWPPPAPPPPAPSPPTPTRAVLSSSGGTSHSFASQLIESGGAATGASLPGQSTVSPQVGLKSTQMLFLVSLGGLPLATLFGVWAAYRQWTGDRKQPSRRGSPATPAKGRDKHKKQVPSKELKKTMHQVPTSDGESDTELSWS